MGPDWRGRLGAIGLALLGCLASTAVPALTLDLPDPAELTAETEDANRETPVPLEPVEAFGAPPERVAGTLSRQAYRIAGSALTPLQLIDRLRPRIGEAGFETLFECADIACGGFDFRFSLDLIGQPDMHVDLGDFRYLAAERDVASGREILMLVASRSQNAAFLHVSTVRPDGAAALPVAPVVRSGDPGPVPEGGSLAAELTRSGRAVLPGLVFGSGSADLGDGPVPSLEDLARFLAERPSSRVILVGHTDAEGALDANIRLSRARAAAVQERLVSAYGVSADQIGGAEGVGFLMPLAPNDSEAGRTSNRRVEAVLLDLE